MTSYTDREGQELHIGDTIYFMGRQTDASVIVGLNGGYIFIIRKNKVRTIHPHFVLKAEPLENVCYDARGHQLFKGDKVFFAHDAELREGTVVAATMENGTPMVLIDVGSDYPICCKAESTVCVDVGR